LIQAIFATGLIGGRVRQIKGDKSQTDGLVRRKRTAILAILRY
jgi:hypothetical protein